MRHSYFRIRTALNLVMIGIFTLATAPALASSHIIYVDKTAAGANDGSNWADAYTNVQDALAESTLGAEIWVAAGLYKPTNGSDRTATFQLKNGVEIYGGFGGTEDLRDQRDWLTNLTVLSGDIDNNDTTDGNGIVADADNITGNNSYHVVTSNNTDATAILDGFVITGGLADGTNVGHCGPDCGGGMYNIGSSPTLASVRFSGNRAISRGGGMYNDGSDPTLTNSTFSGNRAETGGGMRNWESNPTLTNVTFSGNSADNDGGGMANDGDDPVIRNTIFWNNRDSTGTGTATASIYDFDAFPEISYSLVQGLNPWGEGNLDGTNADNDPLFVNSPDPGAAPTSASNLRLKAGSPAIDAGNDAFINDIDNAADLDGNPRKVGDAVDLGPYEYFERPDPLFHDRFEAVSQ